MQEEVHVTFFKDPFAQSFSTAELTLEELKTRILLAKAPNKGSLPWLKLAIFGKKRTQKHSDGRGGGSLRHDANVQFITGAELDYDGPADAKDEPGIGFDKAVEMVREMGIRALIYTTPSHTASAPRWRILAPTSKACPNELREKLVARMNGFLGGILHKPESFTLSQSYYYGQAADNSNANHMAVVVEGKFIDLNDALYKHQAAGELKEPQNPFTATAEAAGPTQEFDKGIHGFEAVLAEIGDGEGLKGFNDVLTRAAASYVGLHNGSPFNKEILKGLLREAINNAPKKASRHRDDIPRYLSDHYLNDIIATAARKFVQMLAISVNDFVAYMPMHNYIFIPTRDSWPAASIDSRLPRVPKLDRMGRPIMNPKKNTQRTESPSDWLDKNKPVEQMTWAPGEPMIIKDKLIADGSGWIERKGMTCFNLYRPPSIIPGNPFNALPWLQHIEKIYPEDYQHIINFLAHRVQRPHQKINHALVLGGAQGIGKDTLLEPVKYAIGPWNFQEVNPSAMLDKFNGFVRSVILRVSEARDLGEVNRYTFYEHLKTLCAAPPDVLRCNEKNLREHNVLNCCGVIITTNHKTDGIYLPDGDRRTYIAWSTLSKEDFTPDYWNRLWSWMSDGGHSDVTAYLQQLNISAFDAKAPPPQTEAFHAIVNANHPAEAGELADALDQLGRPDALTLDELEIVSAGDFYEWIVDRKNRRAIPHKLESQGYVPVRNSFVKDGLWVILGRRKTIYSRAELGIGMQVDAARALIKKLEAGPDPSQKYSNKSTVHPFPKSGK